MTGSSHPLRRRQPRTVFFLSTAAVPLVFWLLRGDASHVLVALIGLGLFLAGGYCLFRGVQRPRRWPAKSLGAVLIGATVLLLALFRGLPVWSAAGLAILAIALAIHGFGSDPLLSFRLRLRREATTTGYKIFLAAQRVLNLLPEQVAPLEEADVLSRTLSFRQAILDRMAEDPTLIEAVTPALRQVLTEVANATEVFTDAYAEEPDLQLKATYLLLLSDLSAAFDLTYEKLSQLPASERQSLRPNDNLPDAARA